MAITTSHTISVRAAESDEELRLANSLMAKTYPKSPGISMQWLDSFDAVYPGFQKEHTRIAIIDEQLAGALRLTTETVRIGEARLKTGGLAMVSTAPHLRKLGVCTALIKDSLRYMDDHNYDLSMTFGLQKIYQQFGYEPLLNDYIIQVETDEAFHVGSFPSDINRFRNAKPGDIQAIQKIHQQDDIRVSCSLLRSKAHITNKWGRYDGLKVCTNNSGKVVGYIWLERYNNSTTILEIGGESSNIFPDLLAYSAHIGHEDISPNLQFHLPPEHPFSIYLGTVPTANSVKRNIPVTGHMKFINIHEALEHMIPEWELRVSYTLLQELRCEITIIVDRIPYRIRSNRGAIDISSTMGKNKLSTTEGEFLKLVTGDESIDSIINRVPRLLNRQGRVLLQTLFPKLNPYVYMFDRF